jgi:hypothetical protein
MASGVDTLLVGCGGVDVRVAFEILALGIVCDVGELRLMIGIVSDAMFVVAGVPDFSGRLFASGEGVAALDELYAAGGILVDGGRDQDVDVVGHDREAMEFEFSGVTISEER